MIAVGDFVEIVNIPAQDLGKNGRTLARFDPLRGASGVVGELFADAHGLRSVLVKLDKPNIGEMWVRPSCVRLANGAEEQ